MRIIIRLFILLMIITMTLISSLFLLFNSTTDTIPAGGVEFRIVEGTSATAVGLGLKQAGLIKSELFFKILTRITRLDRSLKAGYIKIIPADTTTSIVKKILNADFIKVTLTIPEGFSLKEINTLLIEKELVTAPELDNFLNDDNYMNKIGLPDYKSPEGFLFPETYTFHKGVKIEKIYSAMVQLFYEKLATAAPGYKNMSDKEIFSKIVIASIIEREVKNSNESPIVSGVFYNRLAQGMKLQSCATVQYVLNKPKERLLEDDLLIDNPYNTYLYKGLPPGPISNPGFNAIKAAFNPVKSDYLFFVVKDPLKGTHHFSNNYEEHLQAQSRYKAIKGFY